MSSSFKLLPGGLNYSLVLQRHTGQTAVLQVLTLGHMRSTDYSTTKRFVDSFLLSIMSTNRCSPNVKKQTKKPDHVKKKMFNHYHVQRKIYV